jgi:hypothetical protein
MFGGQIMTDTQRRWEAANIDKRRAQDRLWKRRMRERQRSAPYGSRLWLARQMRLAYDRQYSHRRYLMGLQKPQAFTFVHLDTTYHDSSLYDVYADSGMSPLECLMAKEEGAYV